MTVKDHWYRPSVGTKERVCGFVGCGKPEDQHVESVGESANMKPHFAIPHPTSPTFCLRCDHRIGHSVHPLIPKGLRK